MSVRISNIRDYFSLHSENRKLAEENARLFNNLNSSFAALQTDLVYPGDTVSRRLFGYYTARVINNSVNKQFNYLTLDKGLKDGMRPDMAVINTDGIVGITKSVSEDYTSVLSVLNKDLVISAKIKNSGYFGPLSWSGNSTEIVTLVDIPHHVKIAEGDTIITSGYGGIFPEGIMIGTIQDFKLKGGNYFVIKVKLSNDFRKVNYVKVIRNYEKSEIDSLENAANK
jgi:rod shape-determining protein MreC